jgi:GNAT superfamily N-acetyltransferase
MAIIRSLRGDDVIEVVDLWNECLQQDPVSREGFRSKVVLNQRYDPRLCLVAEEDHRVVGFIFGVIQDKTGYLNVIFVKDGHRRKGIGTDLLRAFARAVKEEGGTRLSVTWGPGAVMPGVDWIAYPGALEFFSKNGFVEVDRDAVAMSRSLMDYDTPSDVVELEGKLLEEGYVFQQLDEEHVLGLMEFLRAEFPGWENDPRGTLLRYPKNLDCFLIAVKGEKVVGYCQMAIDGLVEHFGPFAVAQSERSKGIGAVLFHKCLKLMQTKGARNVWFARAGGRNYSFYVRHGMKEMRRYAAMDKLI